MSKRLCAQADLPDPGSAGFVIERGGAKVQIMLVRKQGKIFAYENSCPHRFLPLDFEPGQFLDFSREFILCSVHGAMFSIQNGDCVSGPCVGARLNRVEIESRADGIYTIG